MSACKGIALITGSAQGIGRGVALRLAQDGFDIALNDVLSKRDLLRTVADEVEKIGRRVLLVPGDVSVEEDVKGMVQDTSEKLGGLDVMVANAGIAHLPAPLISFELDDWERVMAVNARGAFLCYKYAAQQMIRQGRGGRIIGASSNVGKSATAIASAYCASKFAIRGLTQTAALELGKHNITVNCYAPGLIETPMTTCWTNGDVLFADIDPDFLTFAKNREAMRPIQRIGQPEDIANLVHYLASKEASYVTGQCITIDGGQNLS